MSKTKDLLIEIGTEELPPKNLQRLSKAFVEKITSGLSQAKLSHGEVQRFATPRRLALLVHKLACQQPEHTIEKTRTMSVIKSALASCAACLVTFSSA